MHSNLCQRGKPGAFREGKQKLIANKQTFEQIPLTFPPFTGKILLVLCTVVWGVWPNPVSFISGMCREQAFAPRGVLLVLNIPHFAVIICQLNTHGAHASASWLPIKYKEVC